MESPAAAGMVMAAVSRIPRKVCSRNWSRFLLDIDLDNSGKSTVETEIAKTPKGSSISLELINKYDNEPSSLRE